MIYQTTNWWKWRIILCFVSCSIFLCNGQFLMEKHLVENSNFRSHTVLDLRALLVEKGKFTAHQVVNASIYSGNKEASLPFLIENGQIKLRRRLDRERICPSQPHFYSPGRSPNDQDGSNEQCPSQCCKILHFEVLTDKTVLPHSFFIKMVIDDENDNAPRFGSQSTPYKYLKEDVPVGTRVELPVAFDPDSSKFNVQKYTISDWRMGDENHFKLNTDPTNGRPYMIVTHKLDREKNSAYSFTLVAQDAGPIPNSGSVEIEIQIRDVNDNDPIFDRVSYSDMIPEHVSQKNLFHYQVNDADEGENGRVEVSISDETGRAQRFFSVREDPNGLGGVLSLISEIDYEKHGDMFKFKLLAVDNGKPSRSAVANVEIRVNNVNDHGPIITFMRRGKRLDGNILIQEGTRRGTFIAQIHVSDVDSKLDDIKCKLVRESQYFQLEESRLDHPMALYKQYSLQCAVDIDRETKSKYSVVVECTDSNLDRPLSINGTLRVSVLDVNDNAPKFKQETYIGRINENVKNGEVSMRRIQTTDADSGQNAAVRYLLIDLPEFIGESDVFEIDKSGKLRSKIALDYELKHSYKFLVIGKDLGYPPHSSSATVSVSVVDKNDMQPEFNSSTYNFQVREDADIGTVVGEITANDKDTDLKNTRIRFRLQGDSEDLHLIKINRHTGMIQTKRRLDTETKPTISFNVIAENETPLILPLGMRSPPTVKAIVVISVINVNDNPPEFVLVNERQTHVTFTWEHLGREHANCEPAPYQVRDKDHEGSQFDCCDVKLDNDFDGLFSLMTEAHYVLCALKKPPKPSSYKISLTATDRNGNKTLSAQVTFTVIIKSQPGQQIPGRNGNGQIDTTRDPENQHITIIAILATVAGIFCIILFVIIIALRKCSFENADDDEKPQFHAMPSTLDQGNIRVEGCLSLQPEVCTLLPDNLRDQVPDYYSEDEMCSAQNAYESAGTQYRRKPRNVDATLPAHRFSRSCESLDKAYRAGALSQTSIRQPTNHSYQPSEGTLRRQQSKMSEGTAPLYHTLHKEARRDDYQIIDPFSSIRFKPSEYTATVGGQAYAYDYSSGGAPIRVDVANDCASYKIDDSANKMGSKKSLRNAYFQTSFV